MEKTSKKLLQIIAVILSGLLLALLFFALFFFLIALPNNNNRREDFLAYSPSLSPNTRWTCAENGVSFVVDESEQARGLADFDCRKGIVSIHFGGQGVFTTEQVEIGEYQKDASGRAAIYHLFSAKAAYSDGVCTITYTASDDTMHIFGQTAGDGEVTLTFVKEDLPAPVRFTDDGYATGDGEEVVWIEPEERAG